MLGSLGEIMESPAPPGGIRSASAEPTIEGLMKEFFYGHYGAIQDLGRYFTKHWWYLTNYKGTRGFNRDVAPSWGRMLPVEDEDQDIALKSRSILRVSYGPLLWPPLVLVGSVL